MNANHVNNNIIYGLNEINKAEMLKITAGEMLKITAGETCAYLHLKIFIKIFGPYKFFFLNMLPIVSYSWLALSKIFD